MVENDKPKRAINSIGEIEINYDKLYGRGGSFSDYPT